MALSVYVGELTAPAAPVTTAVFAANLLVNGDFSQVDPTNPETVAPPGWTNVGDVVTENEGVIANSFRGTPAYQRPGQPDTVNFYDFGGNGRGYSTINTGVAQTFATVPGRQYRLTFALSSEFACTDANQTVNTTRVTAGSLSVDVPVPYMPGVVCMQGPAETAAFKKPWVVKTYTFSATGASTTLTFMTTVADDYGSNDPLITGVEVNEISPLLTVNKQLAGSGRLHATDQFVVQIKDANNAVVNDTRNSTTKGTGLTVLDGSGTTGATRLVSGAAYTLAEVMAAGSASLLGSYSPVVACTNANAAGTNVAGINRLGSSVVLAAEDAFVGGLDHVDDALARLGRQIGLHLRADCAAASRVDGLGLEHTDLAGDDGRRGFGFRCAARGVARWEGHLDGGRVGRTDSSTTGREDLDQELL